MTYQIGGRVGAIESADKASVRLFGYGTYQGSRVPPEDVLGPGGIHLALFRAPNPCIRLDSGDEVWGCEVKPLCIDLFAGCFGWSAAWLELGGQVVGFDLEHLPHHGQVPAGAELVLQDVLSLHGSQFKTASLILASPPCQAYSYRAMPWKRAKALPPPSNELFDACFRIQREASEAAGHHIPMVVENVKGAQPWVGRAAWHYGSYYLWGDVPALMPFSGKLLKGRSNFHNEKTGLPSPSFHGAAHEASVQRYQAVKNSGGSWFAEAHNTTSGHSQNPVTGEGVKQHGSGAEWFDKALDERRRQATAIKNGNDWFGPGSDCSLQRRASSRSTARKAASAMIAKIPFELSSHIARCYYPTVEVDSRWRPSANARLLTRPEGTP